MIFSKYGTITSKESEQLLIISLSKGQIHEIIDENYVLTDFSQNKLNLGLDEIFPVIGPQEPFFPELSVVAPSIPLPQTMSG